MTISPNKYKSILIVKLSAIGDVIHALPVAHALKQQYPQSHITWVVERPAYDLLTNNFDIDEIIVFDKPKFKSVMGMIRNTPRFSSMLRKRQFDLAIDLQGLFKSAAITALSGAKEKLGYCNMREMSSWVSKPVCGENYQGHIVERYLDVARFLGCSVSQAVFPINITKEEEQSANLILLNSDLQLPATYAVLAPGTNWPSKCWPAEKFADLAIALASSDIRPVIVGGPGDSKLAAVISSKCNSSVNLVGKTKLKELAYVIKNARFFVGGDTGPMHLATAVGTPAIALFGPTDYLRNGPYGNLHSVVTISDSCIGCWKRQCPKEKNCLDSIEVSQVLQKVQHFVKA